MFTHATLYRRGFGFKVRGLTQSRFLKAQLSQSNFFSDQRQNTSVYKYKSCYRSKC